MNDEINWMDEVLEALGRAAAPMGTPALARAVGVDDKEVARACHRLVRAGQIVAVINGTGHKAYKLADGGAAAAPAEAVAPVAEVAADPAPVAEAAPVPAPVSAAAQVPAAEPSLNDMVFDIIQAAGAPLKTAEILKRVPVPGYLSDHVAKACYSLRRSGRIVAENQGRRGNVLAYRIATPEDAPQMKALVGTGSTGVTRRLLDLLDEVPAPVQLAEIMSRLNESGNNISAVLSNQVKLGRLRKMGRPGASYYWPPGRALPEGWEMGAHREQKRKDTGTVRGRPAPVAAPVQAPAPVPVVAAGRDLTVRVSDGFSAISAAIVAAEDDLLAYVLRLNDENLNRRLALVETLREAAELAAEMRSAA